MSTYVIPHTSVAATLLQPAPGAGYVSLFQANGEVGNGKNTGSVNAGTSSPGQVFAVGLGGINGAFAASLKSAGQHASAYQAIHQDLYNKAGTGLTAFSSQFSPSDPVRFALIQKPDPAFKLPGYDGIVLLDIFKPGLVPHGNPLNYSMLYVVPPNSGNYATNTAFLAAVAATNTTLVQAVGTYNTVHAVPGNAAGLAPVSNIRMCLFSGGIYRGSATVNDVAHNNLLGLEAGLTRSAGLKSGIAQVAFEFSNVGPYLQKTS